MAVCRCGAEMFLDGDIMKCPVCPYQYTVPKKGLSYADLLKENEELKARIRELEWITGDT